MLSRSSRRVALLSFFPFLLFLFLIHRLPYGANLEHGYTRFTTKLHPDEDTNEAHLKAEGWETSKGRPQWGPVEWQPSESTSAGAASSAETSSTKAYMQQILNWGRPREEDGHWPSYGHYIDKKYDPNRWEGLPLY
jgi:hypothetical protein